MAPSGREPGATGGDGESEVNPVAGWRCTRSPGGAALGDRLQRN